MSEPEKVLMPRFRCVHCRRSWSSKSTARAHATRCWYDPANRSCKTCAHFRRGWSEKDRCAADQHFPLFERGGQIRQSLAVDCEAHRVRADYVNRDVIDVLGAVADDLTP